MAPSSVDRVREALQAAGHEDTIQEFLNSTRSALDAAHAVGCNVAQIVKSMVFRHEEQPVLILTSGVNRVDKDKAAQILQKQLESADGKWVRQATGFAIGGVAPIGHITPVIVLIDADLMTMPKIWAAAGSPTHVFATDPVMLQKITDGTVAHIKKS